MKRQIIGVLGCLILIMGNVQQASAQLSDKFIPHMGFFYQIINFRDDLNARDKSEAFYAFSLGTYYTFMHKNDVLSLGLDPSVNFGFNPNRSTTGETGISFLVQAPVFLMGRLGANSTSYNQQKFGIGAGIGGVYSFYREGISKLNAGFFNPSAVVEGTILSGGGTLTFRVHFSLFDPSTTLSTESGTAQDREFNEVNTLGLGIIYGF